LAFLTLEALAFESHLAFKALLLLLLLFFIISDARITDIIILAQRELDNTAALELQRTKMRG
jgi:hypothetical protein